LSLCLLSTHARRRTTRKTTRLIHKWLFFGFSGLESSAAGLSQIGIGNPPGLATHVSSDSKLKYIAKRACCLLFLVLARDSCLSSLPSSPAAVALLAALFSPTNSLNLLFLGGPLLSLLDDHALLFPRSLPQKPRWNSEINTQPHPHTHISSFFSPPATPSFLPSGSPSLSPSSRLSIADRLHGWFQMTLPLFKCPSLERGPERGRA
jgi:hypothetical protein